MLDIIKNKIDLNEFLERIQKEDNLEIYVFDIIDMVFNNSEYLPYLESIFKELNKRDLNILQSIKNKNNETIYVLYESTKSEEPVLNEHINKYINSNIHNILSLFNMPKKQTKSLNDTLIDRIEKLEKEVEQLKIWISDKDLVSHNMR
jgi:hypothetical protein